MLKSTNREDFTVPIGYKRLKFNKHTLWNKSAPSGKNEKSINVHGMFIPDSRVVTIYLEEKYCIIYWPKECLTMYIKSLYIIRPVDFDKFKPISIEICDIGAVPKVFEDRFTCTELFMP